MPVERAKEVVGVAEIRSMENLGVCPHCLTSNTAADDFCTACGAALSPSAEQDTTGIITPENTPEQAADQPAGASLPPRIDADTLITAAPAIASLAAAGRRWPLVAASIIAIAGIAAGVAFAVLWRSQVNHVTHVEQQLDQTQQQLRVASTNLGTTRANLSATTALASRRRAVLVKAQNVLATVDPLLSSVDDIQSKASSIQTQRDVFTSDSNTLTSTMITLANYVIQNNSASIDSVYLQSLIDQANSELGTVQADQANLGSADSGYTAASTGFGIKANAFSTAVRSLQRQLKTVTGP